MSNNRINISKNNYKDKCGKSCSLSIYPYERDITLRWRKNKDGYGGRIQINYKKNKTIKEYVFNDKRYYGTGVAFIDFMNYTGLTINNTIPDAIVTLLLVNQEDEHKLSILIPFIEAGDKGSFSITKGTDLLHNIIDQLNTYQSKEGDPSTQLNNITLSHFVPESDATYYYAKGENKGDYIILQTFQAFKTSDREKLFDKLFNMTTPYNAPHSGVINMGIKEYYMGSEFIKISNIHKEGFTGMSKRVTTFMDPPQPSFAKEPEIEGFTDGSDIYIDCRPVGADEETEPVTVKHERTGLLNDKEKSYIYMFLLILMGCIIFVVILYLINWGLTKIN